MSKEGEGEGATLRAARGEGGAREGLHLGSQTGSEFEEGEKDQSSPVLPKSRGRSHTKLQGTHRMSPIRSIYVGNTVKCISTKCTA